VLVTPDQVLVNVRHSSVNFIAWEQSGKEYLVFDVYVRTNLSLIRFHRYAVLFPKDDIRLSHGEWLGGDVGQVFQTRLRRRRRKAVVEAAGFKNRQHALIASYEHDAGSAAGSCC